MNGRHPERSVFLRGARDLPGDVSKGGTIRELTTKRRGELAELAFAFKAESLGFGVAKPYGDSERYDFIVEPRELSGRCGACETTSGSRSRKKDRVSPPLWRIQVKCTAHLLEGFYHLDAQRHSGGRALPYFPGEVDFLAAYIMPEYTWYILPLGVVHERTSLLFRRYDDQRPSPYDVYREAWHLLRPRMKHCAVCGANTAVG